MVFIVVIKVIFPRVFISASTLFMKGFRRMDIGGGEAGRPERWREVDRGYKSFLITTFNLYYERKDRFRNCNLSFKTSR